VVDAGKLPRNKPSTVIDLTGSEIKILRRGDLITGKTNSLISKSEKETEKIAEFLFKRQVINKKPLVFLLSGDLGCGKTVFSRKIGKVLGVKDKITSPTFVIYNEYKLEKSDIKKFLHADLYKITSEKDLEEIKFLDLFSKNIVSCIEWPENMGEKFLEKLKKKAKIVSVNFSYVDEKTREIKY
jgi:tRNA threonylcarbamoyl adenosine modification protein YjeE